MAIMGTFTFEEDFLVAAKNLQSSGFDNISLLSPVPLEEAQEVLGLGKSSPVRRFSLVGAIIGAISGFAMAVGTALVFILPTGGRAIITLPPYLIITYEMTILFGVLATLLGFYFISGLPAWHDRPYLSSASIDRFPKKKDKLVPLDAPLLLGVEEALNMNRYYNGDTDDFAIFNRGLSQDEIKQVQAGMGKIMAIQPQAKLHTAWVRLKTKYLQ